MNKNSVSIASTNGESPLPSVSARNRAHQRRKHAHVARVDGKSRERSADRFSRRPAKEKLRVAIPRGHETGGIGSDHRDGHLIKEPDPTSSL
jgi:hypothetical protein